MELYNHTNPLFTKWVVSAGLLREPFIVVDIGCQGGEHPRWQYLGDCVEFHGFDPISESIEDQRQAAIGQNKRTFHHLALGNENGKRTFFVKPDQFSSSFYGSGVGSKSREVEMRRLDTLFAEGMIPRADYIKLDCEGFEPEVLKGAQQYLAASNPVCVTSEANFFVSPIYPSTHFQAINELLVQHRLLVFDLNYARTPRAAYAESLARRPWAERDLLRDQPQLVIGQPTTFDVLFCRDFVAELRHLGDFQNTGATVEPPSTDTIIKAMINFELHGLMDCAVELAYSFRALLQDRLNLDIAIEHLLAPPQHPRDMADVRLCLIMIRKLREELNQRRTHSIVVPRRLRRLVRSIIGERATRWLVARL